MKFKSESASGAIKVENVVVPPSSPHITSNPIEHLWAAFKTRLHKDLATAAIPFFFIANMPQCYC